MIRYIHILLQIITNSKSNLMTFSCKKSLNFLQRLNSFRFFIKSNLKQELEGICEIYFKRHSFIFHRKFCWRLYVTRTKTDYLNIKWIMWEICTAKENLFSKASKKTHLLVFINVDSILYITSVIRRFIHDFQNLKHLQKLLLRYFSKW